MVQNEADVRQCPVRFPVDRECPLDPPEQLRTLREREPLTPLRFPDGRTGWLVTGYEPVRTLLADPRFAVHGAHDATPVGPPRPQRPPMPTPPGMFILLDPPDHTRYRKLLTGSFTVRRVRALTPRIEQIVTAHLDRMATVHGPVDLVATFALPIPSLVICELLGVPYHDLAEFQRRSSSLLSGDAVEQARGEILGYLADLVTRRRAEPGSDLLSMLIESEVDGRSLDDGEIVGMAVLLLVAGHETTANMISLGTLALLCNPAQQAAVRDGDQRTVDAAVEELLRYLTVFQQGLSRIATEDVALGSRVIHAGEPVVAALPAANRDPGRFAEPDGLDIARDARGHLAFGHGVHQCIGAPLARVELAAAFGGLLRRFPALRLACDIGDLEFDNEAVVYGPRRLPVRWD